MSTRPRESRSGYSTSSPAGYAGVIGKREGRVLVRAEGAVGVEADAPRPAEDTDVVVEDSAGIAAGEQDREAGDDGRDDEADPEEEEDDEVRDGEQPLEEPLPASHVGIELAGQAKRESGLLGGHVLVLLRLSDWWGYAWATAKRSGVVCDPRTHTRSYWHPA